MSPYDNSGRVKDRHLTLSYRPFPPYVLKQKPLAGIDIDIMETLSSRLGMTVNYLLTKSYTDVTKAVMQGQADLGISTLGIVWLKYQMGLDATTMVIRNIKIAQLNPLPVDSFYTISYPFSTTVWMSTFGTVAAVFVALILMHR